MRTSHHQFAAFAYVLQEGSFSAAAKRLGVTQSTITQHIAKLEAQIGNKLLVRSRDGVSVTRTGQQLRELAERFSQMDQEISGSLQRFSELDFGHLKVIANAPQPALQIIRDFGEKRPGVQIDFRLSDWTSSLSIMRAGEADAGFITDPIRLDDFDQHWIEETRYVAYLREDDPLAERDSLKIQDLIDHTLILPEHGSLTERIVAQKLKDLKLTFPRILRATTFPVMCEAVLQGFGVALFLRNSSLIGDGIVQVPVCEFDSVHQTFLVVAKDQAKLHLLERFVEHVREATIGHSG